MATGVSTSNAATALTCWTRWKYAHHPEYNIVPKTVGPALTRGISGHSILEAFYKAIYEGKSIKAASKDATDELKDMFLDASSEGDFTKATILAELKDIVKLYFEYYADDIETWDILSVELRQDMPLSDERVYMPSRLDMVVKARKGVYKGETSPVDHKFVYDFWSSRALELNIQMPLYIETTRHKFPKAVVKRAIVNQLRYRFKDSEDTPLANRNMADIFRRDPITPTANEIRETVEDHTMIALEVIERRNKSTAEQRFPRTIVKTICDYCSYADLCIAERRGEDTKYLIQSHFKNNDYGYDDRTD